MNAHAILVIKRIVDAKRAFTESSVKEPNMVFLGEEEDKLLDDTGIYPHTARAGRRDARMIDGMRVQVLPLKNGLIIAIAYNESELEFSSLFLEALNKHARDRSPMLWLRRYLGL